MQLDGGNGWCREGSLTDGSWQAGERSDARYVAAEGAKRQLGGRCL